jgi:hypothetical protein
MWPPSWGLGCALRWASRRQKSPIPVRHTCSGAVGRLLGSVNKGRRPGWTAAGTCRSARVVSLRTANAEFGRVGDTTGLLPVAGQRERGLLRRLRRKEPGFLAVVAVGSWERG